MNPKVLLVANWDWVLFNFQLPFARTLQTQGAEVLLVCPDGKYVNRIRDKGFQWHGWSLDRRSTAPLQELRTVFELLRIYRTEKPDVVHHVTIKPILYGSMGAKILKLPHAINTFTGLGYLFSDHDRAGRLRNMIYPFLRWSLNRSGFQHIFLNVKDRDHLVEKDLVKIDQTTIILGEGVDLDRFHPADSSEMKDGKVVVIMGARLLWDKGVEEFIQTARELHNRSLSVEFWLAGEPDPGNPASIPDEVIREWQDENVVRFLGHREDVPNLLRNADVAVLPSYHEGMPSFLVEAAASGLPLIGSDIEGCRKVIKEGVNGYLVPPRNAEELVEAVSKLVNDPELRIQMGKESRSLAETRFSQDSILNDYLQVYRNLGIL